MARVLLVSVVYPPDTVSTSGIVAGLAKGLRDLGHEVAVLTSVPHYNPPSDPRVVPRSSWPYRVNTEGEVRVARCFVPQKRGRVIGRVFHFAILHVTFTLAAVRLFRRSQVAVVVSPPLSLALIAFLLRHIGGTRVIYNAQELWPDVPRDLGVITNRALLWILGALERLIYRQADAVTTIGDQFAEIVRSRGANPDQVIVIPNFVDSSWITPRPKKNMLSEKWGVADRPVVLYAGNIGLTQDFDLVLAAATELPNVEFLIIGGGARVPALRRTLVHRGLPNVRLRPHVASGLVADLYGLADVVIVPLRVGHDRTTIPSKIFSGMAAAKPILACAGPHTDLAAQIRRSSAGLVVRPGDVRAFVDAIRQLLAGEGGWVRSEALASARQHSPAAISGQYSDLISRVLERAGTAL